jgi:hypothetical protein
MSISECKCLLASNIWIVHIQHALARSHTSRNKARAASPGAIGYQTPKNPPEKAEVKTFFTKVCDSSLLNYYCISGLLVEYSVDVSVH